MAFLCLFSTHKTLCSNPNALNRETLDCLVGKQIFRSLHPRFYFLYRVLTYDIVTYGNIQAKYIIAS